MVKTGRKTKLTPELQEQIVKYIEAGAFAKDACQAVGICEWTYYNWIKRGDKALELEDKGEKVPLSEKKFSQFSQSIKKGRAKAIIRNVLAIQKAADKTWQAAAWWLERVAYKNWGRKESIKVKGSISGEEGW